MLLMVIYAVIITIVAVIVTILIVRGKARVIPTVIKDPEKRDYCLHLFSFLKPEYLFCLTRTTPEIAGPEKNLRKMKDIRIKKGNLPI